MFFNTPPIPELRIALFGLRGAGKSTLLASYYGHQQTNAFNHKHGYQLRADQSTGGQLLHSFFNMTENHHFPQATNTFSEYTFDLLVNDVPKPSLRVTWYDYPGEWWTERPNTDAEARARKASLVKLLSSDIGVLLIDGDRYRRDGKSCVCSTLAQFRQEILRLRDDCAAAGRPMTDFPEHWLIAISKADLLPESISAADVAKDILANAIVPLQDVANAMDSKSFGKQFLLLSSAKGDGAKVVDAQKYVGLQLVAPLALAPALDREARRHMKGGYLGPLPDWLMRYGPNARTFLMATASKLPGKYKVAAMALLALVSDDAIEYTADKLREIANAEVKKGKTIEAATMLLTAELRTPEANRAFHQTEKVLGS